MASTTELHNSLSRKRILTLLQHHDAELKRYSVKRIGLFGSFARGDQKKNSDLDFHVEFQKPTFNNFMGLIDYPEKLFGRNVDVLTPDGVNCIRVQYGKEEIWKSVVYT